MHPFLFALGSLLAAVAAIGAITGLLRISSWVHDRYGETASFWAFIGPVLLILTAFATVIYAHHH